MHEKTCIFFLKYKGLIDSFFVRWYTFCVIGALRENEFGSGNCAKIWNNMEVHMTDNELRKLSRSELLQMLIAQMEENKELQTSLEKAQAQLADRQIVAEKAGSLAEAALSLNGVFQAADDAARQYLENIARISQQQDAACRKIQADAEQKAAQIIQEAEEHKKQAKKEADAYWIQVREQVENLLKEHDILRRLLQSDGGNKVE